MNFMQLVCAIFMLYHNAFCYFLQASKDGKRDYNNDFKIFEAPILVEEF